MKQRIIEELKRIEAQHGVKVLYAVESGSRAWGVSVKRQRLRCAVSLCAEKRMVLFDRTA